MDCLIILGGIHLQFDYCVSLALNASSDLIQVYCFSDKNKYLAHFHCIFFVFVFCSSCLNIIVFLRLWSQLFRIYFCIPTIKMLHSCELCIIVVLPYVSNRVYDLMKHSTNWTFISALLYLQRLEECENVCSYRSSMCQLLFIWQYRYICSFQNKWKFYIIKRTKINEWVRWRCWLWFVLTGVQTKTG